MPGDKPDSAIMKMTQSDQTEPKSLPEAATLIVNAVDENSFIPRSSVLKVENEHFRCFLSELLGTFVLVTIGCGCVAQTVLSSRLPFARGSIVTINFGWGVAVMMGIYTAGGVSGGHINPAFTLAAAIFKKLSWKKVPFYMAGQYLGAFLGAVVVYMVYVDAFHEYDSGVRAVPVHVNATAGIFGTFPQEHVTTFQAFTDQVIATALLVLIVFAIVDPRNMEVPKGFVPVAVGFIVIGLTTAFEYNCGAAVNPARDLSPRLFSLMAGWGTEVFSFRDFNWFWVPVIGPHLGAILGAAVYTVCIDLHWPMPTTPEEQVKTSSSKHNGKQEDDCFVQKEKL